MKQAFITGANGFLGLNIAEQLCAAGWDVVGLCQPGTPQTYLERLPVTIVECDITDAATLEVVMPENVDAVFHTAAMTSLWSRQNNLQTRVNVDGTRNVARVALAKSAQRFAHTSTWNVYGTGLPEISEDTPQEGGGSWINYVRTKFLAEEEVQAAVREGLDAVVLNPGHMVGRYDTRNWGRMIRMVHEGTLPGVPRARGSFCHAAAVAQAHIVAAERGRSGENYLLPGVEATFREVIDLIGELTGRPVPARTLPTWLLNVVAHTKTWRAVLTGREPDLTPEGVALMFNDPKILSDKANRELGYEPAPLQVMLEDAHAWMVKERLLS
jgi:nucleoside-diphosphate-sugar epimerase